MSAEKIKTNIQHYIHTFYALLQWHEPDIIIFLSFTAICLVQKIVKVCNNEIETEVSYSVSIFFPKKSPSKSKQTKQIWKVTKSSSQVVIKIIDYLELLWNNIWCNKIDSKHSKQVLLPSLLSLHTLKKTGKPRSCYCWGKHCQQKSTYIRTCCWKKRKK